MYRQYEDPHMVKEWLEAARERLAAEPDNVELHEDVADLTERLNFAWQDDEAAWYGED